MTVQGATCSAAQPFSGCLLPDHSLASEPIVASDGATASGQLNITDGQPCISTLALMGWLLGPAATIMERYMIRRGAWSAKPMS